MKTAQKNNNHHLFRVPKVPTVIGRADFVLDRCKGKKVLHLGCVDEGLTEERIKSENLLHFKLINVATEVWGVDISEKGIRLLQEHGADNLVVGNIEQLDEIEELKGHDFDIILLAEVLEHLNNPGLFLQRVNSCFDSNTTMIITVPNGLRLTGLMRQIKGYEFVHPDHNYWFSCKTLETLMRKNGYSIEELLVYSFFDHTLSFRKVIRKIWRRILGQKASPENTKDTGEQLHAKQQSLLASAFSLLSRTPEILLRKYIHKRNPFFVADGIITVVKPKNKTNDQS